MKRPALFLDRDGVINVDHGYVFKRADFQFIDGIFELVTAACQAGYLVIVVTNQAGIGRGYYSAQDFHVLMDWVSERFEQKGGRIDAVYFCPFHPEHGIGEFKRDSDCRKPAPGMLLQAAREWDIDLDRSVMVGDKLGDMLAAQSANVGTRLLLGETGANEIYAGIRLVADVVRYLRKSEIQVASVVPHSC